MGNCVKIEGKKVCNNDLKKSDVEILESITGLKEDVINEWYENFKTDCPNGMTPIAFRKLYQKIFPKRNSMEFCDHLFRAIDTDNNGIVNLQEVLLATVLASDGKLEEKYNWIYTFYDVDGSGFIDFTEMTGIVKSIYMLGQDILIDKKIKQPAAQAENIFLKMDSNKDGKISKEEFIGFCTKDKVVFKLLDHTGEGGHPLFFGL